MGRRRKRGGQHIVWPVGQETVLAPSASMIARPLDPLGHWGPVSET